jgi:hypothetical protein
MSKRGGKVSRMTPDRMAGSILISLGSIFLGIHFHSPLLIIAVNFLFVGLGFLVVDDKSE